MEILKDGEGQSPMLRLLYAKSITFDCLMKPGEKQTIALVAEAEPQCSKYLKNFKGSLQRLESSIEATKKFKQHLATCLICPPEMAGTIEKEMEGVSRNADIQNPFNYTVFGLFDGGCGEDGEIKYWLIVMEAMPDELDDEEVWDFFHNNFIGPLAVSDTPGELCVFVHKSDDNKLWLLVESNFEFESPLPLSEGGIEEGSGFPIEMYNVGNGQTSLVCLLPDEVKCESKLHGEDAETPAMMAYPELGIYIHGFSKKTVMAFSSLVANELESVAKSAAVTEIRRQCLLNFARFVRGVA